MNDIIGYDLEKSASGHFIQTHCTNPLLTTETLARAIEAYFDAIPENDSLFSVTRVQGRFYWESGKAVNHNPAELLRTQDLSPLFEENSNIYVFSRQSFLNADNNRIGLKPKMFVMDRLEAVDIDDQDDWVLAETLFMLRKKALDSL